MMIIDSMLHTIKQNNFIHNTQYGTYIVNSFDNSIKYNNYIGNQIDSQLSQAFDNSTSTIHNLNNYTNNYWSNAVGDDNDGDLIRDEPYSIDGGVYTDDLPKKDRYDYFSPVVTSPVDVIYEHDSTGNVILWQAKDDNPDYYNISINSMPYHTYISWESGIVSVSIDGLPEGTHTMIIVFSDIYNQTTSDTVIIKVIERTTPTISSHDDVIFEQGETDIILTWQVSDRFPGLYYVMMNGSVFVHTSEWDNGSISLNIDDLVYGTYNITVLIFDQFDNCNSDTVIVQVTDYTTPTIHGPDNFALSQDIVGHIIQWSVFDLNPYTYNITKNGELVISNATWSIHSNISYELDFLSPGVYHYVITVSDIAGNIIEDNVTVSVQATTNDNTTSSISSKSTSPDQTTPTHTNTDPSNNSSSDIIEIGIFENSFVVFLVLLNFYILMRDRIYSNN